MNKNTWKESGPRVHVSPPAPDETPNDREPKKLFVPPRLERAGCFTEVTTQFAGEFSP